MLTAPSLQNLAWYRRFGWKLALAYLALAIGTLVVIFRVSGGAFTYALDDPYIHLALAQRILHGSYSINFGEPASPSSSILWPYLLAPFSTMPFRAWTPLLFNIAAGLGCCAIAGRFAEHWNFLGERAGWLREIFSWGMAFLMVVAFNLIGLTYVGMEHTLQLMLVLGCAYGVLEAYADRPVPLFALVCAVLAPAVRYENLAFTLAVAIVCWLQARRKAAVVTLVCSVLPIILFGLFLKMHGLPFLPTSVLVKGAGAATHKDTGEIGGALFGKLRQIMAVNLASYVHQHLRVKIALVILLVALWLERKRAARRSAIVASLVAIVLSILLSPNGWFFRYEAALSGFVLLLSLAMFAQWRRFAPLWSLGMVLLCCMTYYDPLVRVPYASLAIHLQQEQMHRFEEMYYRKPVGINDLGFVSFDHDPHVYVLDLIGLGSFESAMHSKDKDFLRDSTKKHGVGLLMIYTKWFPDRPSEWQLVGHLRMAQLKRPPATDGDVVDFYTTSPAEADEVKAELRRFATDVPAGVSIEVIP